MGNTLTPSQVAALFDILSHENTYAEIRDFKHPGSLKHYGPPFVIEKGKPSTSPSLQSLVSKFLLNLPGLKDVPEDLWKVQLHEIIEELEKANLSESYDKGAVGSRKTLATAISALIEYPVRGTAGGFPKLSGPNHNYDLSKADDLARAFRNFMDASIYGTALDDLINKTAETDKLADHEPLTQAVHEFILVNIASLMHFTIILSPKGQYLLKLLGNANRLVPYMVIRQTLKIGNVASMISAMMRVVLAKMSVTSITNWIGLTSNQDDGLNLMQHIISTVLHWDIKDLEHRASKIEGDKEGPSKDQIACLKNYINTSPKDQDIIRQHSQQNSISIVISILASSELPTDLSEPTHRLALEYLSVILSVRDRKEIIRVLCRGSPDHLTTTVRTMVAAYEPVIRNIHNAVDLSDTVSDFQVFLSDMLKISKIPPPGKDGEVAIPTVGDFVQLLKKHQYSCHKFVHQCCKNGKELTGWYRDWIKKAASQFQQDTTAPNPTIKDAGHLTEPLNELFFSLPQEQYEKFIPILDAQSKYLEEMHASSRQRLEAVIRSPPSKNPAIAKVLSSSSNSRPPSRAASPDPGGKSPITATLTDSSGPQTDPGPGAYLARWQDLLDKTPITPLMASGEVGSASNKDVVDASTKDVDGKHMTKLPEGNPGAKKVEAGSRTSSKPDVRPLVEALGKDFRNLLGARSVYW